MSFAQFKHLAGGSAGYYPVATDEKGKLARRTAEEMRSLIGSASTSHSHSFVDITGRTNDGVSTGDLWLVWPSSYGSGYFSNLRLQQNVIAVRNRGGGPFIILDFDTYTNEAKTELRLQSSNFAVTTCSLKVEADVSAGADFRMAGSLYCGSNKVIGARQTGMGATLPAATIGGTYNSTVQGQLQAVYDKIILLETKLKSHGLIAG